MRGRRQRELEVLYGLSRQLLQAENVASLLNAISPAIMLVTRAETIVLYLLDGDRRYMAGETAGVPMDDIGLRQLAQTLPAAEMVGTAGEDSAARGGEAAGAAADRWAEPGSAAFDGDARGDWGIDLGVD